MNVVAVNVVAVNVVAGCAPMKSHRPKYQVMETLTDGPYLGHPAKQCSNPEETVYLTMSRRGKELTEVLQPSM